MDFHEKAPPMGIGTILVERGLITESQLDEAIADQKRTGERLDHVLVRLGCVDADKVLEAIGRQFDMEIVDLSEIEVDDEVKISTRRRGRPRKAKAAEEAKAVAEEERSKTAAQVCV